ncbi:MAG TPA: Rieske 2Fe-2S domain-containing protein [Gaiellaceae bacterium]|nr:Rieske 2Fe-2S domain-containing protein [Gaiellaceae bacterium]
MSRKRDLLLAGIVLLAGKLRIRKGAPKPEPNHGAELRVLALLGLSALCSTAFVVVYAVDSLPNQTQLLGASLGLALLFLAAALIVAGQKLVPQEDEVEEYPPVDHEPEQLAIVEIVEEIGERVTRRRLLTLGLLGAGGALGAALLTPALSFGPVLRIGSYFATPWRRGRRLVDEDGKPYKASDIEPDGFYTAFPEDLPTELKEELAAPVVLVRLPVSTLRLPPELQGYDANGIVAYSKICTHAGCAISLYRAPLFQPDEPRPALVCPCHYSTFDPSDGGSVIFGPAGRKLPMLPVYVDPRGYLRARHTFDEAVGPSWWGVRNRKPTP